MLPGLPVPFQPHPDLPDLLPDVPGRSQMEFCCVMLCIPMQCAPRLCQLLPKALTPRWGCAAQDLANRLGSGATQVDSGCPELDADVRSTYVANTTVAGIEAADAILLIGTNPRLEAPVFNARSAVLSLSSSLLQIPCHILRFMIWGFAVCSCADARGGRRA